MGKQRIAVATLFGVTAVFTTREALAVCSNPTSCVCPAGGMVVTASVQPSEGPGRESRVMIDRLVKRFEDTYPELIPDLKVGETVPVTGLPPDTPVGTRILGNAQAVYGKQVGLVKVLDGSPVACSGATFSEEEVLDIALSKDCNSPALAKIPTGPGCDDGDGSGSGGCAVIPNGTRRAEGHVALGIALAGAIVAAARRRRQR